MKNTQEMIEVMQAFDTGKKVEVFLPVSKEWMVLVKGEDNEEPMWNWALYDYRIKNLPR